MMADFDSISKLAKDMAKKMAKDMFAQKLRKEKERRQREREEKAAILKVGQMVVRHCRKTGEDPEIFVKNAIGAKK